MNQSHTELAARKLWETIKILGLQNEKLALQAIAAALESPERVQGEAMRVHVEGFAGNHGWDRNSGEGAFEYVQRKSYLQGLQDGRREVPTPPKAPAQDAQGYEHMKAIKEGERNAACEEYFAARTNIVPKPTNIKLFDAGFERGWDFALRASSPADTKGGA